MFNNNGGFGFDLGALLGNMAGSNNGVNGMWGEGLWAVIILAVLFGYGGNGGGLFGNGGGRSNGVADIDASIQRGFDTSTIISKLDGLANGICSLGYDQLNQMNGINTAIMTGNFGLQSAINGVGTQVQQCCCNLEAALADAKYQRATDTCAITTAIAQAAQSIMNNDNANYRQLHDENVALQMEAKNQQIASLTQRLTMCDTQNMINANGQYIVNTLQPTPRPAYIVQNPNGCCQSGFPFNNGWGWGNGFFG